MIKGVGCDILEINRLEKPVDNSKFMTDYYTEREISYICLLYTSYHVELSTRPADSMGSDEAWEKATDGRRGALEDMGIDYVVNEGDGAFYGPKIDFHLEDSIGKMCIRDRNKGILYRHIRKRNGNGNYGCCIMYGLLEGK